MLDYNKGYDVSPPRMDKIKRFLEMCNNVKDTLKCFQRESKRFGFAPYIEIDPFLKVDLNFADFLDPDVDDAAVLKYCTGQNLLPIKNVFVSFIYAHVNVYSSGRN